MATILIVDDEEPVRNFLAQFLADVGHRTLQAIHGAQALEVAEKEQPDLMISDIMMPVLSGAELCRRLKARTDRRAIPVILMSAAGRRWSVAGPHQRTLAQRLHDAPKPSFVANRRH